MPRASVLAVVLLLTSTGLACDKNATPVTETPGEGSVDKLTRELLETLAEGDRERLQSLSTPALLAALDERAIVTLARTLTWLGQVTSLTETEETLVINGVQRRYRVGFDHGEVTLTITVTNDKVEGFEFDEGQWDVVSERAMEAAAGSLRVAEFTVVEPLDPANISYSLTLEGLTAELREHHVTIEKHVFDGNGNVVYRQDEDDNIRFPQAETGSTGGTITGSVAVPSPGSYNLELTITDRVGDKSLVHHVPLSIP
jgi:hypothetical protein